jgi:ribosome-associated protein
LKKTETQVELLFDVAHSPSLTEAQRQRILSQLKNLIDQDGVLHLTAQSERSQLRNREIVMARFWEVPAVATKQSRTVRDWNCFARPVRRAGCAWRKCWQ